MTTIKRLALGLIFTCACALSINVRAQSPSVEVSTDAESAQFAVQGRAQAVHVEVFSPSGELVFETNETDGQSIRWAMVNRKGEKVSDGVYLATITITDALGQRRKRIEQVTVSSEPSAGSTPVSDAPAPQDSLAPTGAGTAGKIPKWTTATNLGNSVITEGAGGKVGVNIAPTATLQANGLQPAPLANTGTPAPTLLQTTGGKGGNTTVSGKVAGAGASISLLAGQGGDAPAGSKRGNGGNITLQAGSTGAGAGTAGVSGNVLLGPSGVGNVGIGTPTPASRLTVNGTVQLLGATSGIKFADGSVQTRATTVTGVGAANYLVKFTGPSSFGNSAIVESGGSVGIGVVDPAGKLHVVTDDATDAAVFGESTGLYGRGVEGRSSSTYGRAISGFNSGGGLAGYFEGRVTVDGKLSATDLDLATGNASFGTTTRQMINLYGTTYGIGVQFGTQYFRSDLHFGWYRDGVHSDAQLDPGSGGVRLMYLDASGQLTVLANVCAANIPCSSDARLKQNVTGLGYGLNQLLRLRPVTWHWKSEPEGKLQLGLVAQEVEAVMPELVMREADAAKPLGLNYMALLPVAVKAIQEQQQQIKQQEAQIERQSSQIEALTRTVERQQAQLNQVRRAVRRKRADMR